MWSGVLLWLVVLLWLGVLLWLVVLLWPVVVVVLFHLCFLTFIFRYRNPINRPTQAMVADRDIGDNVAFKAGSDASPCDLNLWKFRHVCCRFCVGLL